MTAFGFGFVISWWSRTRIFVPYDDILVQAAPSLLPASGTISKSKFAFSISLNTSIDKPCAFWE